ncbi:MAG: hypothetical protein QG670_1613 [Thermoproteota archaeon]|nr:hypothetical protein [Thermoproteota archaeon]
MGGRKSPQNSLFLNDGVSIRLTGAGDIIDVRYNVTQEMMTPGPVYIQDEKTGKIATLLSVPRVGQLITRKAKVRNLGYGLFLNPDDSITVGSFVTLVVGGFKKEHIVVN